MPFDKIPTVLTIGLFVNCKPRFGVKVRLQLQPALLLPLLLLLVQRVLPLPLQMLRVVQRLLHHANQ